MFAILTSVNKNQTDFPQLVELYLTTCVSELKMFYLPNGEGTVHGLQITD